jgi:hypothetical protein
MGRGRHEITYQRMDAIYQVVEARQPITVRGIAYQLFTLGAIPSMATKHVAMVSRVVTQMREEGLLPWEWVVDETREVEQPASWDDPEDFIASVQRQYRKDYWAQQPLHVEVWSEKGTVRGILQPILDAYAVPFRVQHGFSSATAVFQAASDMARHRSEYSSIVIYVGDYDPSGLYMSEEDLPSRLQRYGCGPQKLELYAVQGVSRLQSHSRMAHTALDISPRSRHNKPVEP